MYLCFHGTKPLSGLPELHLRQCHLFLIRSKNKIIIKACARAILCYLKDKRYRACHCRVADDPSNPSTEAMIGDTIINHSMKLDLILGIFAYGMSNYATRKLRKNAFNAQNNLKR